LQDHEQDRYYLGGFGVVLEGASAYEKESDEKSQHYEIFKTEEALI